MTTFITIIVGRGSREAEEERRQGARSAAEETGTGKPHSIPSQAALGNQERWEGDSIFSGCISAGHSYRSAFCSACWLLVEPAHLGR